jgi:hypothetical protein
LKILLVILQEDCSEFQVAACDAKTLFRKSPVILKIVPKAGHDMYTGENQQMIAKEEKSEVLFRRLLRIIRNCFQRRKQKFSIIFLFQKAT